MRRVSREREGFQEVPLWCGGSSGSNSGTVDLAFVALPLNGGSSSGKLCTAPLQSASNAAPSNDPLLRAHAFPHGYMQRVRCHVYLTKLADKHTTNASPPAASFQANLGSSVLGAMALCTTRCGTALRY
jgi:hypothetical protein